MRGIKTILLTRLGSAEIHEDLDLLSFDEVHTEMTKEGLELFYAGKTKTFAWVELSPSQLSLGRNPWALSCNFMPEKSQVPDARFEVNFSRPLIEDIVLAKSMAEEFLKKSHRQDLALRWIPAAGLAISC